jgi:hypothetical protein
MKNPAKTFEVSIAVNIAEEFISALVSLSAMEGEDRVKGLLIYFPAKDNDGEFIQ